MKCSCCGENLDQKTSENSWKHLFRMEGDKAKTVRRALSKGDVPKVLQEKLKIRGHSLKRDVLVITVKEREHWRMETDGGNIEVKRTGKERLDIFFWDRKIARKEVKKLPAIIIRGGDTPSAICRECAREDEKL